MAPGVGRRLTVGAGHENRDLLPLPPKRTASKEYPHLSGGGPGEGEWGGPLVLALMKCAMKLKLPSVPEERLDDGK